MLQTKSVYLDYLLFFERFVLLFVKQYTKYICIVLVFYTAAVALSYFSFCICLNMATAPKRMRYSINR